MAVDALTVNGLQKSFGKNHVFRGIDVTLSAGSVTVLMGANGAGKSTLVKVICGHHRADGGRMMLAGENPGASVIVPPTLITPAFLNGEDIRNMEDLGAKMPQFQHADVALADWMPLPPR